MKSRPEKQSLQQSSFCIVKLSAGETLVERFFRPETLKAKRGRRTEQPGRGRPQPARQRDDRRVAELRYQLPPGDTFSISLVSLGWNMGDAAPNHP